jgi:hypothetical protein
MFGSNAKFKIASEFDALAKQSQNDIDTLKTQNPFETAAAKSAMVRASQNAQNFYNRGMNVMGANASPEAMVAAQGQASDAVAGAAGNIATGAEENRNNQLMRLKLLNQQQMGASADIKINAINSEWDDFFKGIDAISGAASGGGQAAGSLITAMSDKRLKENIKKIGEIQGHNVYKFNYIGDPKTIIGVIAQEIEENDCVVPIGDYLSVNYDKLFKEV